MVETCLVLVAKVELLISLVAIILKKKKETEKETLTQASDLSEIS